MIARDAQHSHRVALTVQHCVRAEFSGGFGGDEQHLLPRTCIKAEYGKRRGTVSHRGNAVVSEEAKALHALAATFTVTTSLFCLQSPLERKRDWHGWVVLCVHGVNSMKT